MKLKQRQAQRVKPARNGSKMFINSRGPSICSAAETDANHEAKESILQINQITSPARQKLIINIKKDKIVSFLNNDKNSIQNEAMQTKTQLNDGSNQFVPIQN